MLKPRELIKRPIQRKASDTIYMRRRSGNAEVGMSLVGVFLSGNGSKRERVEVGTPKWE